MCVGLVDLPDMTRNISTDLASKGATLYLPLSSARSRPPEGATQITCSGEGGEGGGRGVMERVEGEGQGNGRERVRGGFVKMRTKLR